MDTKRYVVMGAGTVGCHLARTLSAEGHAVTLIDRDPGKRQMIEEQLDVGFVLGNGTHMPALEAAEVDRCELFVAASSSDEANLAASLLAKVAGAKRTVVRVATSEDITKYGRTYERTFQADLLLSTQLLTTTRILNNVAGYNTLEIEYLARGALQVRRTHIEPGSVLHQKRLADVDLPAGCLVLAFISGNRLVVPTGESRAQPGDEALVLATTEVIDEVERRISGHSRRLGLVVIAGGGATAQAVATTLVHEVKVLRIIEADRQRAEELAATFPDCEIIHGDATDVSALAAQGVANAQTFIALTGHDETNLMACLMAQELGAHQLTALVQKSETSSLWRRVGLLEVVSPRVIAAERIRAYIDNNYEAHILSFENGAAQFLQRHIEKQSAAAGGRLADIEIPQGLIVAAVMRGGKAIIPRGDLLLEAGDDVIVFALRSEAPLVNLLFPGSDGE
ncbi:MAG: Trk system potassium transporter TrkA [Myxococcota bacterium]